MSKDADKVEAGKAEAIAYAPPKQNVESGLGDGGSGVSGMLQRLVKPVVTGLGVLLCLFTLFEVNYNTLQPQSALAVFVGVGLALCYLTFPVHKRLAGVRSLRFVDIVLAILAAACCMYVIVQTQPIFSSLWGDGISLGDRAGGETGIDFARLHEKALLTRSFEELVSSCEVLSRTRRTKDHRITWASMNRSVLRACGGDYIHVIQTLCFIEGTEVAILFIEQEDGTYKLSLRSRGAVDVGRAARDLDSGGGGHERAAGCTLRGGSFEEIRERVVTHFEMCLRERDRSER